MVRCHSGRVNLRRLLAGGSLVRIVRLRERARSESRPPMSGGTAISAKQPAAFRSRFEPAVCRRSLRHRHGRWRVTMIRYHARPVVGVTVLFSLAPLTAWQEATEPSLSSTSKDLMKRVGDDLLLDTQPRILFVTFCAFEMSKPPKPNSPTTIKRHNRGRGTVLKSQT